MAVPFGACGRRFLLNPSGETFPERGMVPPGFFPEETMDKEFFVAFLRWLDTASDQELDDRRARIQALLGERRVRSSGPRKDAEWMIRKIDEERLARFR